MRKITIAIACVLLLLIKVSTASPEYERQGYTVDLETTNLEYSLGRIEKNSIIREIVKVVNELDEPLTLKEARSTCECIQVYVEPQIVEKGELFEVKVAFNTIGMNQGDIDEIAYIMTGNRNYELIRLVISATVVDTK
jgi:hypothetical protein